MILDEIALYAKERVAHDKIACSFDTIKLHAISLPKGDFRFEKAITEKKLSIICEVKKASPSKGIIAQEFPYLDIALEYEKAGADCISVLTEPKWFLGSDEIFESIRRITTLPLLRKDFTIDEYQLYQSKIMGADAVLLICALLDTNTLQQYLSICDNLGLSALVETHNQDEILSAIAAGARIIGVNNRNLHDFSVDLSNASNLRQYIPSNIAFVAESGIKTHTDAIALAKAGANALLIGEALMRCEDKSVFLTQIKEGVSYDEN